MQPHCTIDARRYRAVLFDLDGVITDTMRFHYEAFHKAFERLGLDVKSLDIYTHEGMPSMKLGRALVEEYGASVSDEELKKTVDEKRELYRQMAEGNIRAYPGVPETLAMLRENGVKLALVTGSNRRSVTKVVEEAGLTGMFDAIVTGEDTERGKPFPDPYLKGMDKLGADKAYSVVVENAPMGIKAAKAAGVDYVIAVTTTLPEQYFKDADDIMPSFADLGDCLAKRIEASSGG
ncbi:putative haloacid dehalogenase [Methanocella paludicola SANAE]|uniref:Haloacid dehalogenase n=1 Tax=Methanocella paludicola (strain DSM 17711 / JCM 13418 / NBRC 101707 / SANAE) TaxID=304371 RepID=D1Z058_METPS|nr:HAD family phosphatase [Methanocella paludicola]BAI62080.1 putative haloacid dehalogenase [Methanocella paludicola SANAE]